MKRDLCRGCCVSIFRFVRIDLRLIELKTGVGVMFILPSEARRLFPPTVALFFCVLSLIEFCPQVGCHSGHVDLSPTTPPGEKDFCLNTENSGEMSGMRMVEKIKTTVDELVIDFLELNCRFLFEFLLVSKWLTLPYPRNWKLDSRSSRKPPTASLC